MHGTIFLTPKRHPTQRFINTHVNPTSHCFPGRSAGFFGGFCRQARRPCEWNLAALVFFKLLPLLGKVLNKQMMWRPSLTPRLWGYATSGSDSEEAQLEVEPWLAPVQSRKTCWYWGKVQVPSSMLWSDRASKPSQIHQQSTSPMIHDSLGRDQSRGPWH